MIILSHLLVRMQLEMALSRLHSQSGVEELLFWGKINGTLNYPLTHIGLVNDYYVAVGITFSGIYEFPTKKFYWALSTDFKFSELPDLND